VFCVFRSATLKILISKNLDGADPGLPLQNLETSLRLTRELLRNKSKVLALEIAATPLGWDDDRISSLWNARADVTRESAKLWRTSADIPLKAKEALNGRPACLYGPVLVD
jgi:hypothetical protein